MAQPEVQNGGSETVAVAAAAVSFTAVKPHLLVEAPKANDAVLFYKAAFGAEEVDRTLHPKRKAEQEQPLILRAELKLAGFTFVVSDFAEDSASSLVFLSLFLLFLIYRSMNLLCFVEILALLLLICHRISPYFCEHCFFLFSFTGS